MYFSSNVADVTTEGKLPPVKDIFIKFSIDGDLVGWKVGEDAPHPSIL